MTFKMAVILDNVHLEFDFEDHDADVIVIEGNAV
jgi:hypothetical protein